MAKIFTTNGNGASQTLNEASSNRIKVYNSIEDVVTTALTDGEIISTKEGVNTGNVYDYVKQLINQTVDLGPDYENGVTTQISSGLTTFRTVSYTATEDCYIVARHYTVNMGGTEQAVNVTLSIAGLDVASVLYQGYGGNVVSSPIKLHKGTTVEIAYTGYSNRGWWMNYTIYPVKHPEL